MIRYVVKGQSIYPYGRREIIADNSLNFIEIQFDFSEEWAGMMKTARFSQDERSYDQILIKDKCFLPAEIVTGNMKVSVYGYREDGSRGTTEPINENVVRSGFEGSSEPAIPPTPDIYAQLLQAFNQSIANSVPIIGENGNWWIWDVLEEKYIDTGSYSGGEAPYIGSNGNWFIGHEDTGVSATGPKGDKGEQGVGIKSITLKSSTTEGNLYTVMLTDGSTQEILSPTGPAGSDATVTSTNIKVALGYTPADEKVVSQLSEEVANLAGNIGTKYETKSGEIVTVTPVKGTTAKVVSKITGQDAGWNRANILQLRQLKGKNLFDFVSLFGGAGTVVEKDGLKATINHNGTATIVGRNTSGGWTKPFDVNIADDKYKEYRWIFPAGTYTVPWPLSVRVGRADGVWGSFGAFSGTFTVGEPFWILGVTLPYDAGVAVDATVPLCMVSGISLPSTGYNFEGEVYNAIFSNRVTDGEFNWQTGELRGADGNLIETVAGIEEFPVLDGANTFMTGVGTSTVTYKVPDDGSGDNGAAEAFDPEVWGMPVLYLDGNITGMSKDNAVDLQYVYGERSGTASVKWQGSSSLAYPKKNYTIKFDNAFEAVDGWGEQKKYCLKANYIDCSHARNLVSAKLWGQIVKARASVPAELAGLPNCGAVDGFPCVIMLNGAFHGLYTFNIPKDGWMFGMGNGSRECIMCANDHSAATRFETTAVCDGTDFEIEYITDENDTQWAIDSLNALISAVLASDGSDIDSVIAERVDIDSAIDFYLYTVLQSGTDNEDKNYILATFDGIKWFFSTYDMDSTFGLNWTGKTYWNPETAWPSFVGFQNTLFQLLRMYKPGAIKRRYMELRKGVLSDGAVILAFTEFMATIPSTLRNEDFKTWPLIPSTLTNDLSQISTNYLLRTKSVDAVINAIVVPITNLVPTSIDPQTGEIFGGVGYQDNYVATTPEYGYKEDGDNTGYVSTGLIEFPVYSVTAEGQVYESPVMYVKGGIEFSTSDEKCRITSYAANLSSAVASSKAGRLYFNAEKLGEGYYRITYLPNNAGIKAKIVDWTGIIPEYAQLTMRGTGSGLIVSVGEPIE